MSGEPEAERVGRTYAGYTADPRRQRAWSAENPGNAAIRDELVATAFALAGPDLGRARAVLDVGCGTGWWLERLERDPRVTARLSGVDVLADRVQAASARVPTAALAVADARALPFDDAAFDVVTLFTVLSSLAGVAAAEQALREVGRVLAPGGVVLVWEPRLPNPRNRATFLVRPGLVRRALAPAAVQTATLTLLPGLARRLGARTEALYPRLARVPALRSHRLLVARRPG